MVKYLVNTRYPLSALAVLRRLSKKSLLKFVVSQITLVWKVHTGSSASAHEVAYLVSDWRIMEWTQDANCLTFWLSTDVQ